VAAGAGAERRLDARQRFRQVLMDIVAQRFERRHVKHSRLVRQRARQSGPKQLIERSQKSRQGFARTRWRGN
jgi:hypothetical protein